MVKLDMFGLIFSMLNAGLIVAICLQPKAWKMTEFICDEFVRRYLLSHNYTKTLAALDAESSSDSLSDCVVFHFFPNNSEFSFSPHELLNVLIAQYQIWIVKLWIVYGRALMIVSA